MDQSLNANTTAYLDPATAAKVGFRDGFLGHAAQSVSDGIDQQTAYLDAFRRGREHRKDVEHACKVEGLTVDEVMRKSFDFYYRSKYGTRSSETPG